MLFLLQLNVLCTDSVHDVRALAYHPPGDRSGPNETYLPDGCV